MQTAEQCRSAIWAQRIADKKSRALKPLPLIVEGRLKRMVGLTIEAVGCRAAIGDRCLIKSASGGDIEAEVVGFSGDQTYLMPTGQVHGVVPNAPVIPTGKTYEAVGGYGLLGRVLNGAGRPLDDKGPLNSEKRIPLVPKTINPLTRQRINEALDVGIGSINSLLTIGRGQRLGLFAGSGVGKSVLLGMMTRYTEADVTVVGLIGERGREVKEFTENILGDDGMSRAVVVATPADEPPLMRMHGAMLATSIAEYFRDQGKNVLLLMDSLTRFAQAQREIALAIGEPPVTKGYPPSVFAKIPQLVERAGNGDKNGGSITALYTVLTEGDDQQDPVADAARAILDGHIVLSRSLAEAGHYPAIDIEASISRVMNEITSESVQLQARRFKKLYSTYQSNKDLISVGAYRPGNNAELDEAVNYYPHLVDFLQQDIGEKRMLDDSYQELEKIISHDQMLAQQVAR